MNTINAEEILIPLIKCRCRSFSRIFPAQTQSPMQTRSHLVDTSHVLTSHNNNIPTHQQPVGVGLHYQLPIWVDASCFLAITDMLTDRQTYRQTDRQDRQTEQ